MVENFTSDFTAEQLARDFEYLDELRESGVTNMFGAAPYLDNAMGYGDIRLSRSILSMWMKSDRESPMDARVSSALARDETPEGN